MGNSMMLPLGRMVPILLLRDSLLNQRLPSGPAVSPLGWLWEVGMGNSVRVPLGLMRPILLPRNSVNQRLPSGPVVISPGPLPGVGMGNSVRAPMGVGRVILALGVVVSWVPSGAAAAEVG